jgi:hypothetical protein
MESKGSYDDVDDERLSDIKEKLKAGRLEKEDLQALESLVERTEAATRMLRAAIVE